MLGEIIFLFIISFFIRKKFFDKGKIGEKKVAKQLERLDRNKYKVINNVILKTSRGTSQIDHLVISQYGIFVLETKNYTGWIFGSERADKWQQIIYKKKSFFRNPIKQNYSHIKALEENIELAPLHNPANLMGISTRSTTIRIYMLSTGLATLAGIVFSIYTQAGYALAGVGVELDAIASVVIGGTLLSGGVGTVLGTLFGVAIQGLIQTYINFDGTLSSWWTKIAIGILLFIFIALQRGLTVLWENRQSSPVTRVNIAQR